MITTGEGGMITTSDATLAEKARVLRATGASISDLERHKAKGVLIQKYEDIGYNYRMTDIQAAIGLVQMRKIGAMLEQRTRQARRYDEALSHLSEDVEPPFVPEHSTHAYTSYLIRLRPASGIKRDELLRSMADRGISCRAGIQPLHQEPFYENEYRGVSMPASEEAARSTMFLPIFPGLTEEQQGRIIQSLEECLASCRPRETVA